MSLLVVHHAGDPSGTVCRTAEQEVALLRAGSRWQRLGRPDSQRLPDYGYTCALGTHTGRLYEAIGDRVGLHAPGVNASSVGLLLTGSWPSAPDSADRRRLANLIVSAHQRLVAGGLLARHARIVTHHAAPGLSKPTACPAGLAATVAAAEALRASGAPPLVTPPARPEVRPMFDPPVALEPVVDSLACPTGGAWLLAASGAVYAFAGAPYRGGMTEVHLRHHFVGRTAARLRGAAHPKGGPGYVIVAGSGEEYGPDFDPNPAGR